MAGRPRALRVAFDFTRLDAITIKFGLRRYATDLIVGLSEVAPPAHILVLGSQPQPVPEIAHVFETPEAFSYCRLPALAFRGAQYLDHLRYGWTLARERAALLHAPHTFMPLAARCPVIVTVHDMMMELFPEYAITRRSRVYRTYKWSLRHKSRRAICDSETTASDLTRLWGVPRDMIDVVLLGTDLERWQRSTPPSPSLAGPASELTIASQYNLEPRKNLQSLLKAFAGLRVAQPDLRLALFGRSAVTPERELAFESTLRDLAIADAVTRTGPLDDDELAQLYRSAALFVFPSLYEGFGLPLLEAMAAGACVVARNASAMAEVAGSAGLLVETADSEELAAAMVSLLRDTERRRALRHAARHRAAEFTRRRMAEHCSALRGR
jgi:glycosyltransferase involved in cell wall biosynthesis